MAQSNNSNNQPFTIEKKFGISSSFSSSSSSTSSSEEQVRIIGISEHAEAAQCLAEAFAVDDVARYFIDTDDMKAYTEEYKWKLHVDILNYITAAHCYKGIVTTVGEDYGAVALWMPPGKNMDDLWTIFRSGMWRLWYKLSKEGKKRFYDEFLPLLHDTKHDVMGERDDDSYYLVYLGSKKSARGKGYAKKLIAHMLEKADLEGKATYLESSTHNNIAYYTRFGFKEAMDIELKRGPKPVKLHIMVREPQVMAVKDKEQMVTVKAL